MKKKRKRQSLTDLQLFLLNEVAPTESRQGSFEGPPHIQIFEPGKPSSLARPHPLAEKHHSIVASHPSAEARLDSSQTGKPSSEAREYSFVSRQPPTEARKPSSHARPHPSTKRLDSMMARHPSAEARQPSSGARHAFSEARQHSIVARIPSSEARPYSSQAGKPSSEAREHSIVARQSIARQPSAPLPPEEELEEPADIVDHGVGSALVSWYLYSPVSLTPSISREQRSSTLLPRRSHQTKKSSQNLRQCRIQVDSVDGPRKKL